MKRIKVLLTAVTVIAVVGGTLAFKAHSYGSTIYCADDADGFCNDAKSNFTIVKPTGVSSSGNDDCTSSSQEATCNTRATYVLN